MTTGGEPNDRQHDPTLDAVMGERRQLINLAYRLLGSVADAEDVVQETYARWYAMSPTEQQEIENPAAWLSKVASRVALDLLRSARARRERYVGEWVPEPLPGRTEWTSGPFVDDAADPADPADRVTLDESISMAFLVVLESMTPAERVAFILHDVFRYPFAEVAEIVGRSPEACRQLASSARRRIRATQTAPTPSPQAAEVVRRFKIAWTAKDVEALVGLLDPDVAAVGDGGGRATAALEPVVGADAVARYFADLARLAGAATIADDLVNGQPGLVVRLGGEAIAVLAFEVADDRIRRIWAVRNPDKLRLWATG